MYQKYFIGCSYNHQKYVLAQKILVAIGNISVMNILVVILFGLQQNVLFISDIQLKIFPNLLA